MGILRFESWCKNAVSGICGRAERERAYAELYAHMEDQYEELVSQGASEINAEKAVVAAMGSFADTAHQLEKLYPPIWHHLLTAARLVLLFAFLLAACTVPRYVKDLHIRPSNMDSYFNELSLDEEYRGDGTVFDRRTFYAEPMSRDESDGYRFTWTRAAERHISWVDEEGSAQDTDRFYLTVEVFKLGFWRERSDLLREFYAVDSLGNRYEASNRALFDTDSMRLRGNPRRAGIFTYAWDLWLDGYCSQEAEWIELRYDRSSRSVRLCVQLKGGAAE